MYRSQRYKPTRKPCEAGTNLDVFVRLFRSERTAIAEKINKANGNAAIDIENERVLLRCGDLLDRECVIE